jgi:hypothetical protein
MSRGINEEKNEEMNEEKNEEKNEQKKPRSARWVYNRSIGRRDWRNFHWIPDTRRRTKNQEPRTKNQEPRTKNQEPRTKNQEPRTKNQEPRTKNQEKGFYFCTKFNIEKYDSLSVGDVRIWGWKFGACCP